MLQYTLVLNSQYSMTKTINTMTHCDTTALFDIFFADKHQHLMIPRKPISHCMTDIL